MLQKRLYITIILLSIIKTLLFGTMFILYLNEASFIEGLAYYLYWLSFQVILLMIALYTYHLGDFNQKKLLKLSLLYLIPLLLFLIYIIIPLGTIHLHQILFPIYLILFILTTLIYIYLGTRPLYKK